MLIKKLLIGEIRDISRIIVFANPLEFLGECHSSSTTFKEIYYPEKLVWINNKWKVALARNINSLRNSPDIKKSMSTLS